MIEPFLCQFNVFEDTRGILFESFNMSILNEYNISFNVEQENVCVSHKNTIRGLHYQTEQNSQQKILIVLNGKIKDVVIDLRKGSNTYGKKWEFEMSSDVKQFLYIPCGFAHGYASYSDNTIVSYKMDKAYNKNYERGINPLCKLLNIKWNINDPIISRKDTKFESFNDNIIVSINCSTEKL